MISTQKYIGVKTNAVTTNFGEQEAQAEAIF